MRNQCLGHLDPKRIMLIARSFFISGKIRSRNEFSTQKIQGTADKTELSKTLHCVRLTLKRSEFSMVYYRLRTLALKARSKRG